jgi:tetratricopeptide (TPR) repeat protein
VYRRLILAATVIAALSSVFGGERAFAQDPAPDSGSKPAEPPAAKPKDKSKTDTAIKAAADQPTWDPLRAENDLQVGQYYMKRGDVDAAIDRFEDATVAKPGYAIPFRYLGEAQEKKGLKKQAIKSYTKYLDLYPHAEDKNKIQKKIDKLYEEVEKEKKQR